jgi:hypothetical protein
MRGVQVVDNDWAGAIREVLRLKEKHSRKSTGSDHGDARQAPTNRGRIH